MYREIIFISIGGIIGFMAGVSADLWGAFRAKRKYDRTIAYKNELIDKLTKKH
jgi:hypothetical protein